MADIMATEFVFICMATAVKFCFLHSLTLTTWWRPVYAAETFSCFGFSIITVEYRRIMSLLRVSEFFLGNMFTTGVFFIFSSSTTTVRVYVCFPHCFSKQSPTMVHLPYSSTSGVPRNLVEDRGQRARGSGSEMHGSRSKIPSKKNLDRQRCEEEFNSGVKGLMYQQMHVYYL
jgi:hypothetical protein